MSVQYPLFFSSMRISDGPRVGSLLVPAGNGTFSSRVAFPLAAHAPFLYLKRELSSLPAHVVQSANEWDRRTAANGLVARHPYPQSMTRTNSFMKNQTLAQLYQRGTSSLLRPQNCVIFNQVCSFCFCKDS